MRLFLTMLPAGFMIPVSHSDSSSVGGNLRFRWERSVENLQDAWDECLGSHNALASFPLQKAIEASQLDSVEHHYLVGEINDETVCLIPCFEFSVSLVSVASPLFQKIVKSVRSLIPNFLMVRVFVIGSAVSNYGDLLGFKDFQNKQRWHDQALVSVFNEIRKKAASLKIKMLLLKELDDEITQALKPILGDLFFFAESLPSTYLSIAPSSRGGYLASVRSKYRTKIKKRKSMGLEKGLSWRISPVSEGDAVRVYSLYKQVLDHSEFVFERVNEGFFRNVGNAFGRNAFYILGYINEGAEARLISSELVLCDKDSLRLVYSGFDYGVKRDSDLYFNVFYAAIEEAERLGVNGIHLGQTAYEVKAELGAQRVNLSVAGAHLNPLMHKILQSFKAVLFPSVVFPERDVFSVPPPKPKSGNPNRIDLPSFQEVSLLKPS